MSTSTNDLNSLLDSIENSSSRYELEQYVFDMFVDLTTNKKTDLVINLVNTVFEDEKKAVRYSAMFQMQLLQDSIEYLLSILNDEQCSDEDGSDIFFELINILWYFKWILPKLPNYYNITKELIATANEMMNFYYTQFELNLAMYYKTLMLQNINMGQIEQAKENYKLWKQSIISDDMMSDCEACELTEEVRYAHFIKDYEMAIKLAKPLLNNELTCQEVPYITYATVLKSLIALGKQSEAKQLLKTAINEIDQNLYLIAQISEFIEVAYKTNQFDLAKQLIEKYEPTILQAVEPMVLLKFLIAISPFYEDAYKQAAKWALEIDDRNENNYYIEYLADYTGRKIEKSLFYN